MSVDKMGSERIAGRLITTSGPATRQAPGPKVLVGATVQERPPGSGDWWVWVYDADRSLTVARVLSAPEARLLSEATATRVGVGKCSPVFPNAHDAADALRAVVEALYPGCTYYPERALPTVQAGPTQFACLPDADVPPGNVALVIRLHGRFVYAPVTDLPVTVEPLTTLAGGDR